MVFRGLQQSFRIPMPTEQRSQIAKFEKIAYSFIVDAADPSDTGSILPFGRTLHCPVRTVENWLNAAQAEHSPAFHPAARHGQVLVSPLSGEAVS
jgi:hypothetical protein